METNSRSDIRCDALSIAQITETNFFNNKILAIDNINKIVAYRKNSPDLTFYYQKFDLDLASTTIFADFLLASNYYQSSQLACMMFLLNAY